MKHTWNGSRLRFQLKSIWRISRGISSRFCAGENRKRKRSLECGTLEAHFVFAELHINRGREGGSCYVALYSYSFSYIRFIYSGAYVTPCNAFCRLQLKCKSNHRARQGQNATTGGRRRRQGSQGGSYHLPASNQVESSQRVHFRMGCFGTDLSRVVAL